MKFLPVAEVVPPRLIKRQAKPILNGSERATPSPKFTSHRREFYQVQRIEVLTDPLKNLSHLSQAH